MRLMVYGDSNSWGYLDDGEARRFDQRWPVVMAGKLAAAGQPIALIEECLPGRTTTLNDPMMGEAMNGAAMNGAIPLAAVVKSHTPLDHVLFMLGTNDLKVRFDRSAAEIVAGLMELARIATVDAVWEPGSPLARASLPRLSFIAPPALGEKADDPSWDRAEEWSGGRAKSLALPALLDAACRARGYAFFDANAAVTSSALDPIHWDQRNHVKMGEAVAAWMLRSSLL